MQQEERERKRVHLYIRFVTLHSEIDLDSKCYYIQISKQKSVLLLILRNSSVTSVRYVINDCSYTLPIPAPKKQSTPPFIQSNLNLFIHNFKCLSGFGFGLTMINSVLITLHMSELFVRQMAYFFLLSFCFVVYLRDD